MHDDICAYGNIIVTLLVEKSRTIYCETFSPSKLARRLIKGKIRMPQNFNPFRIVFEDKIIEDGENNNSNLNQLLITKR